MSTMIMSAMAFFVLSSILPAGNSDTPIRLKASTISQSQSLPLPKRFLGQEPAQGEKGLYLIQFAGPVRKGWIPEIRGRGVRVLHYVPENSFLVWMDPSSSQNVKNIAPVRWIGFFHPGYRIDPSLSRAVGYTEVTVLVLSGESMESNIQAISSLGGVVLSRYHFDYYEHVRVRIDSGRIVDLAHIAGVIWIEPYREPKLLDEIAAEIDAGFAVSGISPGAYFTWLAAKDFSGTGVTVCIVDSGIDSGNPSTMHPDLVSRVIMGIDWTGSGGWYDLCGHGTHVAGIVGADGTLGTTDSNGFTYGIGIAPAASLIAGKVFNNGCGWGGPGYPTITQWCLQNGATVANNSWGSDCAGSYDSSSSEFDALVRDGDAGHQGDQAFILVFSDDNAGPGPETVGCPATGKNVLTIGASENYRPTLGTLSDNPDQIAPFSSRGPCLDGRLKPDLVAPGTFIASTRTRTGAPVVCGSGIDGNYAYCSGTSMSSPLASGSVALFVDWWRATRGINPSPALTKAALIVGAADLASSGGTAAIPNEDEGWGRITMEGTLAPQETMYYLDQSVVLTTGKAFTTTFVAKNPAHPLKISLVYTDVNGAPFANPALVNNLDLVVTSGTSVYNGNVFSNGWSVPGGNPDTLNNVENVYIQSPGTSTWIVHVYGTHIPENASPNISGQDFALVASNAVERGDFTVSVTPSLLRAVVGFSVSTGVSIDFLGGYVTPVTLHLSPLPESITSTFDPGTVAPPGNSTLSISTTPSVPAGTYGLTLSGTSIDSLITHTTSLTLIVSPPPLVFSVSPTTVQRGFGGDVTVTGENFQNGAAVYFSGSGITIDTTSYQNSGHITSHISVSTEALLGGRDVTVVNPDNGTGSTSGALTVTQEVVSRGKGGGGGCSCTFGSNAGDIERRSDFAFQISCALLGILYLKKHHRKRMPGR